MPTRIPFFLLFIVAISLSACGDSGSHSSANNARSTKPCELLTAEDIAQVTGHAMQPGEEKYNIFCYFSSVEKGKFDQPKFSWHLQHLHHAVPLDREVQEYQTGMREGLGKDAGSYVSTPVAGVGDRAFWERFSGVSHLVAFKASGDGASDFISVQSDNADEAQALEQAKALAQRALDRL